MKFYLIILTFSLFSCSSLFWREASLPAELIYSESNQNLIYSRVYFQEKNSFDPTVANTLKKNYTTKFIPSKLNSSKLEKEFKEFELNSWILPKTSKYFYSKKKLFLIKGEKPDEFGTPERILTEYSIEKNIERNLSKELNIKNLIDFSISASLNFILILYKENSENQISIYEMNESGKYNLLDKKALTKFVISSDGDSEIIFLENEIIIKGYKSCSSYQISTKKLNSCNPFTEYKNQFKGITNLVDENVEFNQIQIR